MYIKGKADAIYQTLNPLRAIMQGNKEDGLITLSIKSDTAEVRVVDNANVMLMEMVIRIPGENIFKKSKTSSEKTETITVEYLPLMKILRSMKKSEVKIAKEKSVLTLKSAKQSRSINLLATPKMPGKYKFAKTTHHVGVDYRDIKDTADQYSKMTHPGVRFLSGQNGAYIACAYQDPTNWWNVEGSQCLDPKCKSNKIVGSIIPSAYFKDAFRGCKPDDEIVCIGWTNYHPIHIEWDQGYACVSIWIAPRIHDGDDIDNAFIYDAIKGKEMKE